MYRISKVSAISEVMEKIEQNNYEDANKMISIITKSIKNDKKNNQYSPYIILKTKKEALLFEGVVEEQEN